MTTQYSNYAEPPAPPAPPPAPAVKPWRGLAIAGFADWEVARLIPVSGINGSDEQERRGSSALLAVLASVKEFGRAITVPLGAPAGTIETFIEVPFQLGDRTVRPDGVIRVSRGKQVWTALVEVKTGRNDLQAAQLEAYLDVAREQQFDVVFTISNQLVGAPGEHPTEVDKKKLRKVNLLHMSWSQIHTEAVIQRVNRSVADPDQAWILAELIRYLEHERSGAVDFDDMGKSWVSVRDATATRTLRPIDPGAVDVVARFGQLVSFAGMRLSRKLGVDVRSALSKAELNDFAAYQQRACNGWSTAASCRVRFGFRMRSPRSRSWPTCALDWSPVQLISRPRLSTATRRA
jgi:hypothetical protein